MQAQEKALIEFLRHKQQFTVPIYQRTYSWTQKQCLKLWEDIKEISQNDEVESHFMGSIVSIKKKLDSSEIPEQVIIDGQQRITTILLLLTAIAQSNIQEERSEELKEDFLMNKHGKGDLRYKMILTQEDRLSLINLIDNRINEEVTSERIKGNFEFFAGKLINENPEKIYLGIRKLMIVDISLDPKYDNPQLIFESLNSTGLALSQGDLIRNFILMGLPTKHQKKLYEHYWHVMERYFDQANDRTLFDRFMRDYLTIKNHYIPNIKDVYETFKDYFFRNGASENVDEIVKDIHKFSKFYTRISLATEPNIKLKAAFADLNELKVEVVYPFLLSIYSDFEDEIISEEGFCEILQLIESYIFRRFICGIPASSLNAAFISLYGKIDKDHYLESLKAKMILMTHYRRFPNDTEFTKALKEKDLYNIRNRRFWLRKFENFGRKEYVKVENYTIEHIMPQNPNLSEEWIRDLGENWKEVQDNYLHTLGNLTLTGYNSELGDQSFARKKTSEGGFDCSPIRLNSSVAKFSVWNEDSIRKRADILAGEMVDIWPLPKISNEIIDRYKEKSTENNIYTIESIVGGSFLTHGPIKELFTVFRKELMKLDPSVYEYFIKTAIHYKIGDEVFMSIVPQRSKLTATLKLTAQEVDSHNKLNIKDLSNLGHAGAGNISASIDSLADLEAFMKLIKQSLDKHSEN